VDGTIEAIGSDHAPHTREEKLNDDVWQAAAGFVGVETGLALFLSLAVNAGRMTLEQSSARAAQNSSSSARGSSCRSGSLSSSRTRSPASVPPGSRSRRASGPSASRSSAAWVVFPERSIPSSVTNTLDPTSRTCCGRAFAAPSAARPPG